MLIVQKTYASKEKGIKSRLPFETVNKQDVGGEEEEDEEQEEQGQEQEQEEQKEQEQELEQEKREEQEEEWERELSPVWNLSFFIFFLLPLCMVNYHEKIKKIKNYHVVCLTHEHSVSYARAGKKLGLGEKFTFLGLSFLKVVLVLVYKEDRTQNYDTRRTSHTPFSMWRHFL